MKPEIVQAYLLPACANLFPHRTGSMMSLEAQAMLLAIGLQESEFKHRQQLTGGFRDWWKSLTGPAAGYWQFERIGVKGVMEHQSTKGMAQQLCITMGYPVDVDTIWSAIRYDNILAVAFARLALYRLPQPLPKRDQPGIAWSQYLSAWRPGKPHPEKWERNWERAWSIVKP